MTGPGEPGSDPSADSGKPAPGSDPSDDPSLPDATPAEREILSEVDRRITGAETLDEAMNWLFDRTADLFPCDRLALAFLEEEGHRVVARWVRARYAPLRLDCGYSEDTAGSSLQKILESGRVRILSDLQAHARTHPGSRSTRLLLEEGVRSSLTGPLRVENRPVGFLFRSSRLPNAYAPRHVRLHRAMAARLSQAVEKVWRLDRLAAANAAYLEMLGFASHDLRSPLGAIILDSDLLLEGYLGDLDPRQAQKIGRIKQSAISLHAMAGQYLELARIESGELRVQLESGVDIWTRIVEPALALQEGALQAGRHPVEQDGPRPLTARLDPLLLRTACANLLGNAVKYGREGGRIRIRAERKEGRISLSVWNEGPGFPEEMRQRLFRRFSRLPAAEKSQRKGAGLGLYIVWRIAQAHGGRVIADSREGEWAEFRLEIPEA